MKTEAIDWLELELANVADDVAHRFFPDFDPHGIVLEIRRAAAISVEYRLEEGM